MDYICKIATLNELEDKWNEQIKKHSDNDNWKIWKEDNIKLFKSNKSIVYYGILDNKTICEATVFIDKSAYINSDKLIDNKTAYLTGFRTDKKYENKGYFSILYNYMENDLKQRGYNKLTLGVEACEVRNMMIYFKYGYTEYIKSDYESYPDGKKILVNFYAKDIRSEEK